MAVDLLGSEDGELAEDVRAAVALALALTALDEALALAEQISDASLRDETLSGIAGRLAPSDPHKALGVLGQVSDSLIAEPVQAQVVRSLVRESTEEALALARSLRTRRLRVEALLAVATAL